MDFYTYIAENEPEYCLSLFDKYGCEVEWDNTVTGLGYCLQQLADQCGEDVVIDLAAKHPDKDLIIECYLNANRGSKKHSPALKQFRHRGSGFMPNGVDKSDVIILALAVVGAIAILSINRK